MPSKGSMQKKEKRLNTIKEHKEASSTGSKRENCVGCSELWRQDAGPARQQTEDLRRVAIQSDSCC